MPYYDFDGVQITVTEWLQLHNNEQRVVVQTMICGHEVSTAWIGVGTGPKPLIYETLTFPMYADGAYDQRHATREGARTFHHMVVSMIAREKAEFED